MLRCSCRQQFSHNVPNLLSTRHGARKARDAHCFLPIHHPTRMVYQQSHTTRGSQREGAPPNTMWPCLADAPLANQAGYTSHRRAKQLGRTAKPTQHTAPMIGRTGARHDNARAPDRIGVGGHKPPTRSNKPSCQKALELAPATLGEQIWPLGRPPQHTCEQPVLFQIYICARLPPAIKQHSSAHGNRLAPSTARIAVTDQRRATHCKCEPWPRWQGARANALRHCPPPPPPEQRH